MERSVAIGATSGSLSALVLRLASELLSSPLPVDCPLCAECLDLSIFTLGSLDLPSVALGICIGVLAGPSTWSLLLASCFVAVLGEASVGSACKGLLSSLPACMSSGTCFSRGVWVSEVGAGKVAIRGGLSLELQNLRLDRLLSLEQVDLQSSRSFAPSPRPSPVALAGTDLSAERVAAAESIGAWLRRCLNDQPRGLSGRKNSPS